MSRPLSRPEFLTLTGLGGVAVALAVANGVLFTGNRAAQLDVTTRAAMVQQTAPLELLQRDIARTLADLALRSRDQQVLDMLKANNVTVTQNPPAPSGATPARP